MLRMITVNTLPVAKRWLAKMRAERHPNSRMKVVIWELPYKGRRAADYGYSSDTNYVVGSCKSVETKIAYLGKRIDK